MDVEKLESTAQYVHEEQLDSLLAEIHHNLGCESTESNDPEGALTHFKVFNHLAIQHSNAKPRTQNKRLAISWNELGNAYMLNHRYEEGKLAFSTSISIMKDTENFLWTDVSLPFVNMGLAYWLTGQLEDAVNILLEGLGHREAVYGVDDNQSFMYALVPLDC